MDNASANEAAWDLVPGEIVERHRRHHLEKALIGRKRQRDERGYYLPCSLCQRLAHDIGLNGCAHPHCAAPPSEARVAAARARHADALALIEVEQAHLEDITAETESEEIPSLIDPETAVDRFLGLQALGVGHAPDGEPDGRSESLETAPSVGLLAPARAALEAAARRTGRFTGGYCATPYDNLVDCLTLGQARTALDQLGTGDGTELAARPDAPPKVQAAHSSAALVINTFAGWLGYPRWLPIAGRSGFERIDFEVQFPTGLTGKPPNVDVVLSGPLGALAIESKCTEHLSPHAADFPDSYDDLVAEIAERSWRDLFAVLKSAPETYRWVNVGQLVRHYLGLRRALLDGRLSSAALMYVYWEPADADDHVAIREHREEVAGLAGRVSDASVPFVAQPYSELWSDWSAPGAPAWVVAHVAALRSRYDVPISSS
jgi:hypothetical protein